MNMRRPWLVAMFITSALLMAACATPMGRTTVLGSWKADNYSNKLSSFLIISLSDEPGIRGKFESIMAGRLKKEGLRAVASSSIMPADQEINRETVMAVMAGKGIEGVLVSRLLGVDRQVVYVPPSADTTFESTFTRDVPAIITPGFVAHSSVITLQVDLYDAASEHLVWSLKFQAVNPDNTTDVMNNLSDAVVEDLRIRGLI